MEELWLWLRAQSLHSHLGLEGVRAEQSHREERPRIDRVDQRINLLSPREAKNDTHQEHTSLLANKVAKRPDRLASSPAVNLGC